MNISSKNNSDIVKKNDVRFPLEVFIKYRYANKKIPDKLVPYIRKNYQCQQHSCLQLPEIRAYLNSHMTKKNMSSEDEILYNKIQGLLNKLSQANFSDIAIDIKELPYVKRKHVFKLCEIIILKAINEMSYCDTYAKLTLSLLPYFIIDHKSVGDKLVDEKVQFRLCLLTICQDIFEQLTNIREVGKPYEYERSVDYSKLKLTGLMKWFAELYNNDIVNDKFILQSFNVLYSGILKGDDYYDPFNVFILTILNKLKKNVSVYKKIKDSVYAMLDADKKGTIDFDGQTYNFKFNKSQNKFKIIDIIDAIKTE